jgi:hypothetical protein
VGNLNRSSSGDMPRQHVRRELNRWHTISVNEGLGALSVEVVPSFNVEVQKPVKNGVSLTAVLIDESARSHIVVRGSTVFMTCFHVSTSPIFLQRLTRCLISSSTFSPFQSYRVGLQTPEAKLHAPRHECIVILLGRSRTHGTSSCSARRFLLPRNCGGRTRTSRA